MAGPAGDHHRRPAHARVLPEPSGAQVLLPAYALSDAHHGSWTVLAVTDDALSFATN